MNVVCLKCGSDNKKGNKFCFECGFRLPDPKAAKGPIPASKARIIKLKKRWLRGELTAEEYRARLLKLRLKERFKQTEEGEEPSED